MTDNDRLFGPLRARLLEPTETADALKRAVNAWPTPLVDCGLIAVPDGSYVRLYRGTPTLMIR